MFGKIIGKVGEKSVKVEVERVTKLLIGKRIKQLSVVKARIEQPFTIGQKVEIVRSRPFSKTIKWLVKV